MPGGEVSQLYILYLFFHSNYMRTIFILILIMLFTTGLANAQVNKDGLIYRGNQNFVPCMDIGVGYIFDHKYEKITISSSFNNFIYKRYGMFTMVELNPSNPAFVLGPTITIFDFAYIWGGIDLFTARGLFQRGGFRYARKDLGIGFYPWKWAVVKIAHSFNAGSRIEVGFRIPLRNEANYLRIRTRL
jgi:hypothetical protein